jgi:hypothetical protein
MLVSAGVSTGSAVSHQAFWVGRSVPNEIGCGWFLLSFGLPLTRWLPSGSYPISCCRQRYPKVILPPRLWHLCSTLSLKSHRLIRACRALGCPHWPLARGLPAHRDCISWQHLGCSTSAHVLSPSVTAQQTGRSLRRPTWHLHRALAAHRHCTIEASDTLLCAGVVNIRHLGGGFG